MRRKPKGRLELTWMGKDSALIPAEDGKYDYSWVTPTDPRALEVKSINPTAIIGAADGPTGADENLLIVGDSGDALRSLGTFPEYASRYLGAVKLVYIDPPFNTSQTFEHYNDQLEHSIWLTMMRDRIRDIKPLLASDASIWVHLDDAEVHRMRVLLDEEFGAGNFIAEVIWQKVYSPKNSAKHLSVDQDYLLVYALNADLWRPNQLPRTASMDAAYRNPDDDPRGPWKPGDLLANKPYSLGRYPIATPSGRQIAGPPPGRYWRVSAETLGAMDTDGRIYWGPNGDNVPAVKRFLSEVRGAVPKTLWTYSEVGHNQTAKNEIQTLFPGVSPFTTPKPEALIERIIQIASNPGDLVLDCFAGSGTTAAVAHKMGRRWVTVELQPSTVETFIVPRLTRVVDGKDLGGITSKKERVAVADLPEGMSPEDAQQFNTLLTRAAKAVDGLDPATLKALRAATRTRDAVTVQWEGGGGFTVAHMGPSMYDVDDETGDVFLSQHATNGAWSKAIAGQLRFTLTPGHPVFCGVRGRQRLAVIDGVANETIINTIVEQLGDREKAVIVAKAVTAEAATLLQQLSPGSRIRKAPGDLFPKGTTK